MEKIFLLAAPVPFMMFSSALIGFAFVQLHGVWGVLRLSLIIGGVLMLAGIYPVTSLMMNLGWNSIPLLVAGLILLYFCISALFTDAWVFYRLFKLKEAEENNS